MLAITRYVPNPDDTCNLLVRDRNKPFLTTAVKPCGRQTVASFKLLCDPFGAGRHLNLCASHACELIHHLSDALEERIDPDRDYPPGTEIPGF
jgi:hypothetical protein